MGNVAQQRGTGARPDSHLTDPLEMIRRWAHSLRDPGAAGIPAPTHEVADDMDEYLRRCVPDSPSGTRIRACF